MDFAIYIVRGIYAFHALVILTFCLVFVIRRCLWRSKRSKRGFFPTYAAAGNALQSLQVMVQPKVDYVLAEKFEDESEDDDEGDLLDPAKHLQQQLRRIKRGEPVHRLTVIATGNRSSHNCGDLDEVDSH